MTLGNFNQKFLDLMYFLVTSQRFLNSTEIAALYRKNGKEISDRNIRRWLSYLNKNYFWYYPSIKYESLGLMPVFVLVNGYKTSELFDLIPYRFYTNLDTNLSTFGKCAISIYAIPPRYFNNFRKFWSLVKKRKLIGSFKIYSFRTPFTIYSNFAKIIAKDGNIDFRHNEPARYFLEMFRTYASDKNNQLSRGKLLNNPLIIPRIFEYYRVYISSKKVWENIRRRLRDKLFSYIVGKRKIEISDASGIKIVQKTMRSLQNNFNQFFIQMRVSYLPFTFKNCDLFTIVTKLKNIEDLYKFSDVIAQKSVSTTICLPTYKKSKIVILFIETTFRSITELLNDIFPQYIDKSFESTVTVRDTKNSLEYWGKFEQESRAYLKWNYGELFNPLTLKWSYNSSKYIKELNKIIKRFS